MKTNNQVEPKASKLLSEGYEDRKPDTPTIWFSKRFYVTLLLFLGCANMYTMRANLSIALVEMTSNKTFTIGNQTVVEPPEFKLSSKQIGVAISMFSYGYLSSLFGGFLSTKFGGSTVYGFSMVGASLITLLYPISLRTNFYVFLALRALTGVSESFAYASTADILSRWAPIRERSTLMSFSYSGMYVGTAITYPLCGLIVRKYGWPMAFYLTGVVSFIWCIVWLILVRNDPSKDKQISKKELDYIRLGTDIKSRKEVTHPYCKILLSSTFWALACAKFSASVGFTILIYCFPLYVKDMTGKTTDQIGLIASIPNIVSIFSIPLVGSLIDYCQNNSTLKITQIHKIILLFGNTAAAAFFIAVIYANSFFVAMICFVFIQIMLSCNFVIQQLVCIYMAPQHSSALAGLSVFWFTVGSIVGPTVVGFVVEDHNQQEWAIIFLLIAVTLIIGATIFALFGSSDLQPWAVTPKDSIAARPIVKNTKNRDLNTS